MIRITHVITGLGTGGAETTLCRLLETLRPPRFEHTVIALGSAGALSARVAECATLHHLGMHAAAALPHNLWRLRRILQASAPDVIHAWMHHANLMAALTVFGTNTSLLWGVRQSLYDLHREKSATRWLIRANQVLSWRPARIIYNSLTGATQHEAIGFRSAQRLMIPNGFDTGRFRADGAARARVRAELAIGNGSLAIGLIARWHSMKDHANFLHAAALFVRSHPQSIFVLVGEGLDAENAEVTSLISSLGLEARVRLCGRRTDIAEVNAALDIASSSSWAEAFPNAIGEAMACGVPCVATDVGDVREIIGDTGIVVPSRDPEALCAGWENLAAMDETKRRELGLRARQRVIDNYSLAAMASRYVDVYADVTRKR